ncbi:hypothetical protein EV128_12020 [Rhizobium azibense]|nr:hypothetical protein EV128_12020 [Rhizobium azibense]
MSEYLGITVGFVTVLAWQFWAGSSNTRRRRDLPSKQLCVFDPAGTPKGLRKLVGSDHRESARLVPLRRHDGRRQDQGKPVAFVNLHPFGAMLRASPPVE